MGAPLPHDRAHAPDRHEQGLLSVSLTRLSTVSEVVQQSQGKIRRGSGNSGEKGSD